MSCFKILDLQTLSVLCFDSHLSSETFFLVVKLKVLFPPAQKALLLAEDDQKLRVYMHVCVLRSVFNDWTEVILTLFFHILCV